MSDKLIEVGQQRGIVKPVGSPKELTDALKAYKDMQESLDKAMPDCIITIQGKKFRKKNYWRGVKTAFNLKVERIHEERVDVIPDDWGYLVTYRATAPNGSTADGDGACMASEKIVYQKEWVNGKSKRKLAESGNPIVDQLKTAENQTVHNVRGHAHTRAFNRAVSNLVGFGEVSAEEINREDKKFSVRESIKQPEAKKSESGKPTVTVKVEKTEVKKGKTKGKEWSLYIISCSDNNKYSTFDSSVAQEAKASKEFDKSVEIGYIQGEKGRNIISLKTVDNGISGCTKDVKTCDHSEMQDDVFYCQGNDGKVCQFEKPF